MNSTLVGLVLVTAGTATSDDVLIRMLGTPEHCLRVWAQTKLSDRAARGLYPPTAAKLRETLRTTCDYEIRARAIVIYYSSITTRMAAAYNQLDDATGLDYPCVDAMYFDPVRIKYDDKHPNCIDFGPANYSAPDFPDKPGRLFHSLRPMTRRMAATKLASGVPLPDVLAELDRLHEIDARYYLRSGRDWDGKPAPYVIAALRWDAIHRTIAISPQPTAVPMVMPQVP